MHHRTVGYSSNWLVPGAVLPEGPNFHQITLTWDRHHPEAAGTLFIDPNVCGLDQFGDRTICSKIAVALSDLKLTLLAEKPGHQAYTVATRPRGSTDDYTALPLRLVTIAAQNNEPAQVRLLIVNAGQTVERIIELHQNGAV